ncbi:MAG: BREX-3 system phosphatase PglZ [Halanaerobiales bacterium]
MSNWRKQILEKFIPNLSNLYIVADPDNLLVDEGILQSIGEKGFNIITFQDPIAFRYIYETKYRSKWDTINEESNLLIVRHELDNLKELPYDLLNKGLQLSFTLIDLFPEFSYPVIKELDPSSLDILYKAQNEINPRNLGVNKTKDFILRHVFEIVPELIKQKSDLLRMLLRLHYKDMYIPDILNHHLIKYLKDSGKFKDWPLKQIISDKESFLSFVQERWPLFLDSLINSSEDDKIYEAKVDYKFRYEGPRYLPLGHEDVRVYIDNYFLDGLLEPIDYEKKNKLSDKWFKVGINYDPFNDKLRRFDGLMKLARQNLPSINTRHQSWLLFSYRWAELILLWNELKDDLPLDYSNRFLDLQKAIDNLFLEWVKKRYSGLFNQPPIPPVMVHQVLRSLTRKIEENNYYNKIALIVIDGLSLDQWLVIKSILYKQDGSLSFKENAVFAWLPTLTSISRQSLFGGKLPFYFSDSIYYTNKDERHWTQFWSDQGVNKKNIAYLNVLGEDVVKEVNNVLIEKSINVLGIVIRKVDKIMHGMQLGTAGMHNQIKQWTQQ